MSAAQKSTPQGRFNPLTLAVSSQADIINSARPTNANLVVSDPVTIDVNGETVHFLNYLPDAPGGSNSALSAGQYSLSIQCVIHHGTSVAAIVTQGVTTSFAVPVNYHPARLLEDFRQHLSKQIALALGHKSFSLLRVSHPEMDNTIVQGNDNPLLPTNDVQAIMNGMLHIDEVNQKITISVPLMLIGTIPDSLQLDYSLMQFADDIVWLRQTDLTLMPAFRDYISRCDTVSFCDQAKPA